MPHRDENTAKTKKARAERPRQHPLGEQTEALRYLKAWLKFRHTSQRVVAAALGVSAPTLSSWIGGYQAMTVGDFRKIAAILNASPEQILAPPELAEANGSPVEETLALMSKLSAEERETVLKVARALAAGKG